MPDQATGSPLKVLLIEDSKLLQELLSGILQELDGIELCGTAETEFDALQQMAKSPVDMAIIDIQLKEGSGTGVLAALQADPKRFGTPRKIVLTNFAHAAMRQRCTSLGMDAFFDKSLHINQLIDYLSDAVRQNSGHG
ncbi:MAG: response regulator transcription factor [Sulfuriferula multivorans]|uniref:Response regulator transcription factor n=1 Tax=Sulfuriferula multivorans TaxID=1559896 RepID=A0A7C9P8A6_9PROT|nr:response regulator transcription factor [Sulfuriferula multivorans]